MLPLEKFKQMQDRLRLHMNRTDELYEVALKINEKLCEFEKPRHYVSKEVQTMEYSFEAIHHLSANFNKAVLQNYKKTFDQNFEVENDKCKKAGYTHFHMNTRQKINPNKIKRPLITYPVFGRRKRRKFIPIKKLDSIHTFDQAHGLTSNNNKEPHAISSFKTIPDLYTNLTNQNSYLNTPMFKENLDKKSSHHLSLPTLLMSHESCIKKQNATATICQNMIDDLSLKINMSKSINTLDLKSDHSIANGPLPSNNDLSESDKTLKQRLIYISDSSHKTYNEEFKKRGRAKFKNKIALFKNLNHRKMLKLVRPKATLSDTNIINNHYNPVPCNNKLQNGSNDSISLPNLSYNSLDSSNTKSNKCYKCHFCSKIFGTSHGRLVHFSIMHKIGFGYQNPYLISDRSYKLTEQQKKSLTTIMQSSVPPSSSNANNLLDKIDPANIHTLRVQKLDSIPYDVNNKCKVLPNY